MSVEVTASSSKVTATASGSTVQAAVGSTIVSASSSGGIGPQGPAGAAGPTGEAGPPGADGAAGSSAVVSVTAPITNSGTSSAATIGLAFGGGLAVVGSTLVVTGVSIYDVTGLPDALLLKADASALSGKANTTHSHGSITSAGAIGSTSGRVVVTGASGVLTTAATISATTQVSGLATVATSGSASDLGSGTLPAARLPSHTHAIADVTGLQTSLDGKQASGSYAAATHTHAISDLTQSGATANQVIQWNGTAWTPATVTAGSVAWSSVTGTPTTLAGYGITDAASSTHSHAASAITSGTFDIARIPTGTSSSTVCIGSDSRLSDARTPTSHTHALSDLQQGGATSGQVVSWNGTAWVPATVSGGGGGSTSASDLTSGTLNDARLSSKSQAAMNLYLWSNFR